MVKTKLKTKTKILRTIETEIKHPQMFKITRRLVPLQTCLVLSWAQRALESITVNCVATGALSHALRSID
jgi:hypothetical protein